MAEQTLWEGKVKLILRGDGEKRILSLDFDFDTERLLNILDNAKPEWRGTIISSLIGLFEKFKTILLLHQIMSEENEER